MSIETATELKHTDTAEVVRGLEPVDWVQVHLTASRSPAQRVLAGMRAQTFAMAALRGTLHRRFPDLSPSELNMKVLAYLTPVRIHHPADADRERP